MELISIFSFLKEHIHDGGFIQMKSKKPPMSPLDWVSLYKKEFGKMHDCMMDYLYKNGLTDESKIIIQNLLYNYISITNESFYNIYDIKTRAKKEKNSNLLYAFLHNFTNDIIDDIERYQKAAKKSKERFLNIENIANENIDDFSIKIPPVSVSVLSNPLLNNSNTASKDSLFIEYLFHPQKEELANLLKTVFKDEKGKVLKVLIEVLKEKKILAFGNGEFHRFYNSMKEFFGWNIGSYNSINGFHFDKVLHKVDYDAVKTKVDIITEQIL